MSVFAFDFALACRHLHPGTLIKIKRWHDQEGSWLTWPLGFDLCTCLLVQCTRTIHLHEMKLEYYRGGYDSFRTLFAARMVHQISRPSLLACMLEVLPTKWRFA